MGKSETRGRWTSNSARTTPTPAPQRAAGSHVGVGPALPAGWVLTMRGPSNLELLLRVNAVLILSRPPQPKAPALEKPVPFGAYKIDATTRQAGGLHRPFLLRLRPIIRLPSRKVRGAVWWSSPEGNIWAVENLWAFLISPPASAPGCISAVFKPSPGTVSASLLKVPTDW